MYTNTGIMELNDFEIDFVSGGYGFTDAFLAADEWISDIDGGAFASGASFAIGGAAFVVGVVTIGSPVAFGLAVAGGIALLGGAIGIGYSLAG